MAYHQGSRMSTYSRLNHLCELDIDEPVTHTRLTGMMATVGPACDSVEMLKAMMMEGINLFRFNLAYRDYQYFEEAIKRTREAEAELDLPSPVLIGIDITGPGIRLGWLKEEKGLHQELKMKRGEKMRFTSDEAYRFEGNTDVMYANIGRVIDKVQIGFEIFIEDGPLCLTVVEKGNDYLDCEVIEPGELGSCMMWSIPGLLPGPPELTRKDKEDIKFILEHNVEIIFASFVWTPTLIKQIKQELGERRNTMKIIAKIENKEGVKRVSDILRVADGIFIARGTLGIDITPEKVFIAQKSMIGKANMAGKPAICATQMLASMIENARPTRAEATDVANAILDGADCIMLSRETARGRHPLKAVQMLEKICLQAEETVFSDQLMTDIRLTTPATKLMDTTHTTAIAAVEAAVNCHAKAIVVVTATGRSATLIAKYRPRCLIIAITRYQHTARHMHLNRGILSVYYDGSRTPQWEDDVDIRINYGLQKAKELDYISPGDVVIIVTGWTAGAGSTNTVRVVTCPDEHQPIMRLVSTDSTDSTDF